MVYLPMCTIYKYLGNFLALGHYRTNASKGVTAQISIKIKMLSEQIAYKNEYKSRNILVTNRFKANNP